MRTQKYSIKRCSARLALPGASVLALLVIGGALHATTGTTTRVSVDSAGAQGKNASYRPAISADGRFVAFLSYASNLVTNDTNDVGDIFVHDRDSGQTTRVSVDGAGTQANSSSNFPAISAD